MNYDYQDPDRGNEERMERRRKRRRREQRLRVLACVLAAVIIVGAAGAIWFLAAVDREEGRTADAGSGAVVLDAGQAQAPEEDPAAEGSDDAGAQAPAVVILGSDDENEDSGEAAPKAPEVIPETEAAAAPKPQTEDTPAQQAPEAGSREDVIGQARTLALGYDYDAAIGLLKQIPGYESDEEITEAISNYEAERDACVPVDVLTVPHIFYHSLVNDPDAAFNVEVVGQSGVDGMNAWMTTVDEFDKITQSLYDRGFVYVRLRDLVTETVDADGTVHFEQNTHLMLPEGKKPVVLSVDDLSYYHSYESASFPDKLVLDDEGRVRCHYVKTDGTESIGDYDVVPRLESFLREHPDGAYRGARGLIALTGYNGVFGYRTDIDYLVREHLMSDQSKWLEEHPDFDYDREIAEATQIADALKAEGWEFASHTWGHLSVTGKTAEALATDNEKWVNTVQNIVGPVDTIIFAHGNDIGSWEGYTADNPQYAYYNSAGYHFYCNVDSSVPYWVQITDAYVRQGRIDLDGYMLYQASQGNTSVLDQFMDPQEVFDSRRPTPVIANGEV